MESSVLAMFLFLFHGAAVSHAVLPPEIYWKTMLPDVPMPKAVKELLQPGNARKGVSDGAELDPNIFHYIGGKLSEPNIFNYNAGKQSGANLFEDNAGKQSGANIFHYNAGKQSGANLFEDNAGKQSGANIFNYNAGKQSGANLFEDNAGKQSGANIFDDNAGKHSEPNIFQYNAGNAGKDVSGGEELDPNTFSYIGGKHSEPNIFHYNAGKHSEPNIFHYNAGKHSEPKGFGSKVVKELLQPGNAGKDVSGGAELDPNTFSYIGGKHSEPNIFHYNAGKHSEPNIFHYNAGKYSEPNIFHYNAGKHSEPNIFHYNAGKHSEPKGFGSKVVKELLQPGNTGKDVSGGTERYIGGKHYEPNIFHYNPGKNSYPYVFDTKSKGKVNDYDNIFFLEKELHPGSKINAHLARSTGGATFLPRQQADAIPFSSDMLSKVMEKLSIKPHSMEAKVMEQTIKTCEEPAQEGEEKYCATSLESMVDFVVYKLGKNVQSISTEVGKEETSRQQYTIGLEIKRIGGANSIVCHNQAYAYPVYYCHATHSTKVYVIPFFTTEGSTTKTIAVCHTDTSKWNPEHLAFQVLKIKPGTIPVCHFLPEGHIVWTSDETFA